MTEEFDHYYRLCINRECSTEECRAFLLIVSKITDLDPTDEDVVMIYHVTDDDYHCYDVSLEKDISEKQGEQIFIALEELFPDDDFECEASMDSVSEQLYLNNALLEQLAKNLTNK